MSRCKQTMAMPVNLAFLVPHAIIKGLAKLVLFESSVYYSVRQLLITLMLQEQPPKEVYSTMKDMSRIRGFPEPASSMTDHVQGDRGDEDSLTCAELSLVGDT